MTTESGTDLLTEGVKLLPCPLCGGPARLASGMGEWWVRCDPCDLSGKATSRREAAIAAWSRRSSPVPDREEIVGVLRFAEQFIVNGIAFGFIRMPEPETPDSAHKTLPAIRSLLAKLEGKS